MLTGNSTCLRINHAWSCRAILAFCLLICDRSLGLSLCVPGSQPTGCRAFLASAHGQRDEWLQMASASDISNSPLPGWEAELWQGLMWVLGLVTSPLNTKTQAKKHRQKPSLSSQSLVSCLFPEQKVKAGKKSSTRKLIEVGGKTYPCTHTN